MKVPGVASIRERVVKILTQDGTRDLSSLKRDVRIQENTNETTVKRVIWGLVAQRVLDLDENWQIKLTKQPNITVKSSNKLRSSTRSRPSKVIKSNSRKTAIIRSLLIQEEPDES